MGLFAGVRKGADKNICKRARKRDFRVQKGPLSKEMHEAHSHLVRAGQARARGAGRVGGRKIVYPDAAIRAAVQRHQSGETWASIAASMGMSETWLYARVSKLRREEAPAQAGDANAKAI
jgi:DNA invertase Pin-like site-specific DNA recombinase